MHVSEGWAILAPMCWQARRRGLRVVTLALGSAAALAAGCSESASPSASPAQPPAAEESAPELAALRAELAAERERNAELSAQVDWLQEALEDLALAVQAESERAEAEAGEDGENAPPHGGGRWFDEDALAEAGLPPHEIERTRELFQEAELARIELQNRATREGWLSSGRYNQARTALEASLRQDVGDENYDRMLFAAGRPNRVYVRDVLEGSPGGDAGLQSGDVIIGYGDERVFRPRELVHQTATGAAGEPVEVQVLRDGERHRVFLPRGPIGIRVGPRRMLPLDPW